MEDSHEINFPHQSAGPGDLIREFGGELSYGDSFAESYFFPNASKEGDIFLTIVHSSKEVRVILQPHAGETADEWLADKFLIWQGGAPYEGLEAAFKEFAMPPEGPQKSVLRRVIDRILLGGYKK